MQNTHMMNPDESAATSKVTVTVQMGGTDTTFPQGSQKE